MNALFHNSFLATVFSPSFVPDDYPLQQPPSAVEAGGDAPVANEQNRIPASFKVVPICARIRSSVC